MRHFHVTLLIYARIHSLIKKGLRRLEDVH